MDYGTIAALIGTPAVLGLLVFAAYKWGRSAVQKERAEDSLKGRKESDERQHELEKLSPSDLDARADPWRVRGDK